LAGFGGSVLKLTTQHGTDKTYLKHKLVNANRNRPNHNAIKNLVILFTGSRANINDFPFQIYKKGLAEVLNGCNVYHLQGLGCTQKLFPAEWD
jgi:hypothetical protein